MGNVFEISPAGISKGRGLRVLLEEVGTSPGALYAAGDGGNDRTLLEAAEVAFAPQDAPETIQALAQVVLDRDQNGVLAPMLAYGGIL
jgi:hydroxymethylpyrimidine pyrophosphatase-like HAD family hydrolase